MNDFTHFNEEGRAKMVDVGEKNTSRRSAAAAARVSNGVSDLLKRDLGYYNSYFAAKRSDAATAVADTANDTYLKVNAQEGGTKSYGRMIDLLMAYREIGRDVV